MHCMYLAELETQSLVIRVMNGSLTSRGPATVSWLLTNVVMTADIQDKSIQARSPLAGVIYELMGSLEMPALLLGNGFSVG